jgi:DNA-binding transcriptional LysR family regulator
MELRQLRYFLAVAEELHFGRAARRLHISQPPLSAQIKQLEEEMRLQLFYRTKRKVELTDAGRVFAREARVILQQVEQAAGLASEANRSKQARLVVGCSPANSEVVVRILRELLTREAKHRREPPLDLIVKSLPTPQQIDALRSSQIDLGFITVPTPHEGLVIEPLWSEPLVVALPNGHPLAARRAIALRALERETLIIFPLYMSPGRYESIADMCRKAGFSLNAVHEVDNIHTMLEMVSGCLGIALLRASARLVERPGIETSAKGRARRSAGIQNGRVIFRALQHSPLVETALAFRPDHKIATLPDIAAIAKQVSAKFA